jgi:hypothetical protein
MLKANFHEARVPFLLYEQAKSSQAKLKVSEYPTSGISAKRASAGHMKNNAAACLCFLNYLAFLRPAADRAVSLLPWVVSRGRSYGFLWAGSTIQKRAGGKSNSGLFAC